MCMIPYSPLIAQGGISKNLLPPPSASPNRLVHFTTADSVPNTRPQPHQDNSYRPAPKGSYPKDYSYPATTPSICRSIRQRELRDSAVSGKFADLSSSLLQPTKTLARKLHRWFASPTIHQEALYRHPRQIVCPLPANSIVPFDWWQFDQCCEPQTANRSRAQPRNLDTVGFFSTQAQSSRPPRKNPQSPEFHLLAPIHPTPPEREPRHSYRPSLHTPSLPKQYQR